MHLTTIRNENAYYCCIAQVLESRVHGVPALDMSSRRGWEGPAVLPSPPARPSLLVSPDDFRSPPIYVCGEMAPGRCILLVAAVGVVLVTCGRSRVRAIPS